MNLQSLLIHSSSRHDHLCPRQVLGVRMGLLAVNIFELPVGENPNKRLLTILESDGCFADGVDVATGCTVGHRTLRVEDYGKVAATFVDTSTGRAIRIAPRLDVRARACSFAHAESRHYFAQLQAYQTMPDEEMFTVQEVLLTTPFEQIVSRPGMRVNCDVCGEEIMNEREVHCNRLTLCHICAEGGYYQPVAQDSVLMHNTVLSYTC